MHSSADVTLTSELFNCPISPTKSSLRFLSSFPLHCDNKLSSLTSHYFLQTTCGCMKRLNITLVLLLMLLPLPARIQLHCYLLKSYPPFQVKLKYHILDQGFLSPLPLSKKLCCFSIKPWSYNTDGILLHSIIFVNMLYLPCRETKLVFNELSEGKDSPLP